MQIVSIPSLYKRLPVQLELKRAEPPPHVLKKVWICLCRSLYAVVDAADRVRCSSDGLDKSLKLACGLSMGMLLIPHTEAKYWSWLGKELKHIDGVFSAFAVFGRYNEFFKVDDRGRPLFMKGSGIESKLKNANVAFLAANKTCEFTRLLKTCGLLSNAYLEQMDARYLGGVFSHIGNHTVFGKTLYSAGLVGCKNSFLITACILSITNNSIAILNWKDSHTTSRAALSIGADIGKIYLATAVCVVSHIWIAIAVLTAALGVAKILMDSYRNKGSIAYPDWMNPVWIREQ